MKKLKDQSDLEYKILKNLEMNPKMTQREVALKLDLSLGKTNFVIRSLLERGFVKLTNFRKSDNKIGYLYLLTPEGVSNKSKLAQQYLKLKSEEYASLEKEIANLRNEI